MRESFHSPTQGCRIKRSTLTNFPKWEFGTTIGVGDIDRDVPDIYSIYIYLKSCELYGSNNVILVSLNYNNNVKVSDITFDEICNIVNPTHSMALNPSMFDQSKISNNIENTLIYLLDVFKYTAVQAGFDEPVCMLKSLRKDSKDVIDSGEYHPVLSNLSETLINSIRGGTAPLFNMTNNEVIEAMIEDGYGDIIDKYNMCKMGK